MHKIIPQEVELHNWAFRSHDNAPSNGTRGARRFFNTPYMHHQLPGLLGQLLCLHGWHLFTINGVAKYFASRNPNEQCYMPSTIAAAPQ